MSDENRANAELQRLKEAAEANPEALAEAKRILGEREWPYTVKLNVPVEHGKTTVDALTFQRGNFGILKGLNLSTDRQPTIDQLMAIGARLCGQSLGLIEKLDPDDADEVIAIATGFFGRCQGAGKRLSQL